MRNVLGVFSCMRLTSAVDLAVFFGEVKLYFLAETCIVGAVP